MTEDSLTQITEHSRTNGLEKDLDVIFRVLIFLALPLIEWVS